MSSKPKIEVVNTKHDFFFRISFNEGKTWSCANFYGGPLEDPNGKKYFLATPFHGEKLCKLYELIEVETEVVEI